jgi:hypothetical protein
MAKRIPAGWRLHLGLHYTPIGKPTSDQTEIGLQFADPRDVRRQVVTKLMEDKELRIPAGAAAHRVEHGYRLETGGLLVSLFPHLHFRGKTVRYVAEHPDGSEEVLLDVPAYDFNWQHRYELADPKPLAAGTVIRCTVVYDNSAANPSNPDPAAEVRYGEQSWNEMFYAAFEIALAEEDVREPAARPVFRPVLWAGAAVLLAGTALGWWRARRRPAG